MCGEKNLGEQKKRIKHKLNLKIKFKQLLSENRIVPLCVNCSFLCGGYRFVHDRHILYKLLSVSLPLYETFMHRMKFIPIFILK